MIKKLIDSFHRRAGDSERGSMAIEFAIAAPVVITLFLGAADYGTLMNTAASLRGAARAGTEYAKANWNNPAVTNVTTSTEQQVCSFLALSFDTGTNTCSPVTPSVCESSHPHCYPEGLGASITSHTWSHVLRWRAYPPIV
jgi:Flp pilus assembly protein TadG